MASFLVTCPQCNAMIARDMPCPDCGPPHAEPSDAASPDADIQREFARREGNHKRNYAVFMAIMLATGMVGLVTGIMWFRLIFLGNVLAFFWIILLTMLTAALGVGLKFARKLFPIEFHCPACDLRLDQLGVSGHNCPGCATRLK